MTEELATTKSHYRFATNNSAVFDVINFSLFSNKRPNYWSSNLYNVILFILLAYFFYEVMFRAHYRKIFFVGVICFTVAVMATSIALQDIRSEYQSVVWITEAIILCIYSYTYHVFVSAGSTHVIFNPHLHSELRVIGGVFVYFSFNFAFFIFMNYIMSELDPGSSRLLWSVHNGNNVIKNIFFAFGLFYSGKRKIKITKKEYDQVVSRGSKNVAKSPFLN